MIFIITGEKNTGKTTYARRLVNAIQRKGYRVGGFLSLGEVTADRPKSFHLFDLLTERTRCLARREAMPGFLVCGRFFFDPEVVRSGEAMIRRAIESRSDLVVMDEIGQCELDGRIWDPAFRSALASSCNVLIVVSKKNLEQVISSYILTKYVVFDCTSDPVERATDFVAKNLKEADGIN